MRSMLEKVSDPNVSCVCMTSPAKRPFVDMIPPTAAAMSPPPTPRACDGHNNTSDIFQTPKCCRLSSSSTVTPSLSRTSRTSTCSNTSAWSWDSTPSNMIFRDVRFIRMGGVTESERLVNRLKNTNLEKFRTMVLMHLSFLLDLPGSALESFIGAGPSAPSESDAQVCSNASSDPKSKNRAFFKSWKQPKADKVAESPQGCVFGMVPSSNAIEYIAPVVKFLTQPQNLCQEGLFRKSGQFSRLKTLREKLNAGEDVGTELETGTYSAHDVASLLKQYLAEFPEPLMLEKFYPAYCQIPQMVSGEEDEALLKLKESKQLQTLQLLVQLLPRQNFQLLSLLLDLLHKVAAHPNNKMTPEALGTLLAPCILAPRKMSGGDLQLATDNISRVVTFMIKHATEMLQVPEPLIRDIANYWEEVEESNGDESQQAKLKRRMDSSDAVNTTLTFVDRQASQEAAAKIDTETALAQLYAHVSSMPDSTTKQRLLKRFNKANGFGTPIQCGTPKHKRSKSFGDSIKKIVSRNHKRRESNNSSENQGADENRVPSDGKLTATMPVMRHTPVIKRIVSSDIPSDRSGSVGSSPVLRRIKMDLKNHQPILPSSPKVHIVDMNEIASHHSSYCSMGRKRKVDSVVDCNSPRCINQPCSPTSTHSPMIASSPLSTSAGPLRERHNSSDSDSENDPTLARQCASISKYSKTPENSCSAKSVKFISPITGSLVRAPKSIQTHILTPGSRKPMALIQTP